MRWHVLWLSLIVSLAVAFGLVQGILAIGWRDQLSLMLPLLPLFNAIIFPALEKAFPGPAPQILRFKPAPGRGRWTGALNPILLGFAAGLAMNMLLDLSAWSAYQHFVKGQAWGAIGMIPLARPLRWIRGDMNPFSGWARLSFLFYEMAVVSAFAGLSVGFLSKGRALLDGLITGAVFSMWMGSNQYVPVYETLSNVSGRVLAGIPAAHWRWDYGLMLALFLQMFLCAVFSGLGARWKSGARR